RVPILQAYLRGLKMPHEIIIADDGSRDADDTQKVVKALGCVYVVNPSNMGKGAALRLGMSKARGRFRIYTDADVPYEMDAIERFVWYLDYKEFHMVAGDRTLEGSTYFEHVPSVRSAGSRLMSFLVGRFFASGWFDTQCGIKGFRDYVADDLFGVSKINRFAIDVELLYLALKRNYDIKRLPVNLDFQGKSSVRPIRDGLQILIDIARIRKNQMLGSYRPQGEVLRVIDSYAERKVK
ncbi:MAG: glycosyltransferase, partial [Anaerolineales bacterium]